MMKNRTFELALVLLAVAFVVSLLSDQGADTPTTGEVVTEVAQPVSSEPEPPSPQRPLHIGEKVPGFTLTDHHQQQVIYRPGQGPMFIVLTATGCQECLDRIDKQDSAAHEIAKESGLEVWNLLVFQSAERAPGFVESYQPSADRILADPSSGVSVKLLGGSDSTCWMLIDEQGRLAYRGPVDQEALQKALSAL
jgi:hypothetical protein